MDIIANFIVAFCSFSQRAAKRMAARTIQDGCAATMADNGIVDDGSTQTQPDTSHVFIVRNV